MNLKLIPLALLAVLVVSGCTGFPDQFKPDSSEYEFFVKTPDTVLECIQNVTTLTDWTSICDTVHYTSTMPLASSYLCDDGVVYHLDPTDRDTIASSLDIEILSVDSYTSIIIIRIGNLTCESCNRRVAETTCLAWKEVPA